MISQYIEVLILAFIQGFSEFIPVSSSGHLIIISEIYNFNVGSLQLDISFHLGSLFAIIFYFRNDLFNITKNKNLLLLILLGSLPLIVIGYIFFSTGLIDYFRNLKIIAWTTLIFGLILFFADRSQIKQKLDADYIWVHSPLPWFFIKIFFHINSKVIYTDLDVFKSFYNNECITITGTNGKSTTCQLL